MNTKEYEERNARRNITFQKKLLGEFDFIDRKRKVSQNRNNFSSIRLATDSSFGATGNETANLVRITSSKKLIKTPRGHNANSAYVQRVPGILMRTIAPSQNNHLFWKYPRDRDQKHPDEVIKGFYKELSSGNLKVQNSKLQSSSKPILHQSTNRSNDATHKLDEVDKRIDNLRPEKSLFRIQGPFFSEKKLKDMLKRLRTTDIKSDMFEGILRRLEKKDKNIINIFDGMMSSINDAKSEYISWNKLLSYIREIEEVNQVESWVTKMRRRLRYE